MLYCNHCYASVEVGADNAPTSTTCKFCKQPIKNPVELVEYASLVAHQKHKKIVRWKNILIAVLLITVMSPFTIHFLLIFSQKPHESFYFSRNDGTEIKYFLSETYTWNTFGFFAISVLFLMIALHFFIKLNYISLKKQILWFVLPFVIISSLIIYWESTFNVQYFPLNSQFAKLETAIKIVQVIIFCCIFFLIQKYEAIFIAFYSTFKTKPSPLFIWLAAPFLSVMFFISSYTFWYVDNVYYPTKQAELSAGVEKHNEKWDAYFEEQEATNSN